MIQHLYDSAEKIGNSKTLLRKRLNDAKSVLFKRYGAMFPGTYSFAKKRLYSKCGNYYLQWKNDGETNRGTVWFKHKDD